jgi:hypothetical protein
VKVKLALALAVAVVAVGVVAGIGSAAGSTQLTTASMRGAQACDILGSCCVDVEIASSPSSGQQICCLGEIYGLGEFCPPPKTHQGTPSKPAPPQVNNVFLCYSNGDPVVFPATEAADLLGQGYRLPVAVAGNLDGGNNLGGYHLSCDQTLKPTGHYIDGAGGDADALAATGSTGGLYQVYA